MRVTGPLLKVLAVLLEEQGRELYGLEILRRTGLKSGTLYPLLDRLSEAGWVVGSWEDEPGAGRGPRRRFYRLTGEGVHEARQIFLAHGAGALAWT
jgi:DNA-binding PadR family transcriptional regulator